MSNLRLTDNNSLHSCEGEIEIIIKDVNGRVIDHQRHKNIVKIFAKEILAHRIYGSTIWDPNANSGAGGWVAHGIDPDNDFAVKYFLLGASYDDDGAPLDTVDPRYYEVDTVTGLPVPINLGVGAEYDGGLINGIPISEPDRPLKRVENISFEPTYQPSGTPQLQDDVRAINNIVLLETTLRKEEYNGFGLTSSDFFTITEVALAGGKEFDSVGACGCVPKHLFLEGKSTGTEESAISITMSGGETVTIDPADAAYVSTISEGDQVKIVGAGASTSDETNPFNQVSEYYLVVSKASGGSDIVLDRTPVDVDNIPLTGPAGIFKSSLRIFSHRILTQPVKKSSDFEIILRWSINMG